MGLISALRVALSCVVAVGGLTATTAAAEADTPMNNYVNTWHAEICKTLDDYPNTSGYVGIGNVIMKDGFGPEQAGQIINEAVWNYCPRHSELLETIGDTARAIYAP